MYNIFQCFYRNVIFLTNYLNGTKQTVTGAKKEVFYRDHQKLLPSILAVDKPLNLYIILEYRYPSLHRVLINRRLLIQPLL